MLNLKNMFEALGKEKVAPKAKKMKSAQESIPFQVMYPDGICRVEDNFYSKTLEFSDINYRIAQKEDQEAILEVWSDFLNYFDAGIKLQLSFVNSTTNIEDYENAIAIPRQNDGLDAMRVDYSAMLRNQLARGNNGLVKNKYLTFGISAESLKIAKPRLESIESDLWHNFKSLGVRCESLDGKERLKLCRDILHMDGKAKFNFSWQEVLTSGLSVKDFIAPSSFEFKEKNYFKTGDTIGSSAFLQIMAPKLNDRVLADFLDLDSNLVATMHIEALNQVDAIKTVKRSITELQRMQIDEQKKAVQVGYDMDIMPTSLTSFSTSAHKLLEDMESQNERMFLVTFILVNSAGDKKTLDNIWLQASGIANQHNCPLIKLDFQQEQGFMSSLPLAQNLVPIQRSLVTSNTAIFVPFTTQELFQTGDEALYYGLNALSNNMIMADRKQLKTPNGLILGTPGSGKSFSAKKEIANAILATNDDVIVCDPEGEYFPLVEYFQGQVIKISPNSTQYVNPLDINLNYSDHDNPLVLKSDFILSLCELIIGGKFGLQPIHISIIDRCVQQIYVDYLANPEPENVPILSDLYNALGEQEEKEAGALRSALEIYVSGSLNVFNHQTNVDIENSIVCFDIKELGTQLKKLGMLIVQDQVWNRVTVNRAKKRSTRYYIDEFHLLLKEEQTANYSVDIWKRFRKWGGIPTGITQNVKDLLATREVENIFENSDFVCMLNQAPGDREFLAKQLNISEYQLSYVTGSSVGEGLLFYDNIILPFKDNFPKDSELYKVMTTKLDEV